ncbi:MAG: RdgB/HAM1 family non-canonical purine NTP pyrophosphatase [Spirochaetaceae bacterium]|jgi:XTP/dITP diphosphohydrolase|nr:RdgB/HAM1 family non-canonical purine NTP pyrophosphatase [Spirochaetaceae bacterium]
MIIWLATGNRHKKAEFAGIFSQHTLKIPADEGIAFDPVETGKSFIDNALIKAQYLFSIVKTPVIADDSGLCVDALDGRPGIYSARYGNETTGRTLNDHERNMLLLQALQDKQCRSAHFVCAMVLFLGNDRLYAVQETLEGEILREEQGQGGFGYDTLVYLPDRKCTVASLSKEEKNRISHRGKAARSLQKAGVKDIKPQR